MFNLKGMRLMKNKHLTKLKIDSYCCSDLIQQSIGLGSLAVAQHMNLRVYRGKYKGSPLCEGLLYIRSIFVKYNFPKYIFKFLKIGGARPCVIRSPLT